MSTKSLVSFMLHACLPLCYMRSHHRPHIYSHLPLALPLSSQSAFSPVSLSRITSEIARDRAQMRMAMQQHMLKSVRLEMITCLREQQTIQAELHHLRQRRTLNRGQVPLPLPPSPFSTPPSPFLCRSLKLRCCPLLFFLGSL